MQVIYKNKNEKSNSRGASIVDVVICIGGISRYLERKYYRRFRKRITELSSSRGILADLKEDFKKER